MLKRLLRKLPILKMKYETCNTSAPVSFKNYFIQKILRINGKVYWPVHFTSQISNVENILIGIGTAPGLSPGCYIQGGGEVVIGDYTIIAPNVGIISANHDRYDYRKHIRLSVTIGRYCWIGMNTTVLPGVVLGDHTIVGAGSVVTKSFEEGYCIIGGNPAKLIKPLNKMDCIQYKNEFEYYGYVPKSKMAAFRKKNLKI